MRYLISSIIIISLMGTLAHFMYDLTNHNKIIGLFAAVNESTWEHIKIALTPTFLWSLIDGLYFGENPNYFLAKFVSLIAIIFLIPSLYYGYKKITKKENFIINIIIFYVAIIVSQLLFYFLLEQKSALFLLNYISCVGVFVIFGGYMIHTLMPAKNIIFKDPISKEYGYKGHFIANKKH